MEGKETKTREEERLLAENDFLEKYERERKMGKNKPRDTNPASSVVDSESEVEWKKRHRTSPSEDLRKTTKKGKKADSEEDESEIEEESEARGRDPLHNLGSLMRKLRGWISEPSVARMVKKACTEKNVKLVGEVEEEIIRAREKKVAWRRELKSEADS